MTSLCDLIGSNVTCTSVAHSTKEFDPSIAKPPLSFNAALVNLDLTFSVLNAIDDLTDNMWVKYKVVSFCAKSAKRPLTKRQ